VLACALHRKSSDDLSSWKNFGAQEYRRAFPKRIIDESISARPDQAIAGPAIAL